eukprot:gene30350-39579_t
MAAIVQQQNPKTIVRGFCSVGAENVWAGPHIHSTSHSQDMNPAKSFGTWFEQSVSERHPDLSERLFYQNMSFPCDSCCLCRVYH